MHWMLKQVISRVYILIPEYGQSNAPLFLIGSDSIPIRPALRFLRK